MRSRYNEKKEKVIMQFISATENTQTFATVIEQAKGEPVIIREQNRDIAVILSMADYQRITQINIQEFQKFRKKLGQKAQERGLTEDKLNKLLTQD
jgi:PHD/YefM family antitoxin component YafN of YafNO toxin-antitoxin module